MAMTRRDEAMGFVTTMRPIWKLFSPVEQERWIDGISGIFSDVLPREELVQIVREWEQEDHA